MTKRKFSLLPLLMITLTGCDFFNGPKENLDPNLYHLTFSSNIELSNEQKSQIKATYGYGDASLEIVEGIRPQEEIDALLEAGASESDIQKAGKRQSDGSYYFFSADPIYLEAPKVTGYKLDGFYNKKTGELEDRANITLVDGEKAHSRWNMDDEDTELEARYEKHSYTITFDNMDSDETNPNANLTKYCYLDDGDVYLADATTTNELKTFDCWEYQDTTSDEAEAPWIKLENGKLPIDYDEDLMRIHAVFAHEQFKIDFAFKHYIDPDTIEPFTYEDVISSMSLLSNDATIDGVKEPCIKDSLGTPINNSSEILLDSIDGWANIFFTLKPNLYIYYFEINGVKEESIDASHMDDPYVSISKGQLTKDSTITFVVGDFER